MPVIESAMAETEVGIKIEGERTPVKEVVKEASANKETLSNGGIKERSLDKAANETISNGEVTEPSGDDASKETLTNGDAKEVNGDVRETEVGTKGKIVNGEFEVPKAFVGRRLSMEDELEKLKFSLTMSEEEEDLKVKAETTEPTLIIPVEESIIKEEPMSMEEEQEKEAKETTISEESKESAISEEAKETIISGEVMETTISEEAKETIISGEVMETTISEEAKETIISGEVMETTISEEAKETIISGEVMETTISEEAKETTISEETKETTISEEAMETTISEEAMETTISEEAKETTISEEAKETTISEKANETIVGAEERETKVSEEAVVTEKVKVAEARKETEVNSSSEETRTQVETEEEDKELLIIECDTELSELVEADPSEVNSVGSERRRSVEEAMVDLVMDVESELVGLPLQVKKRSRSEDSTEDQIEQEMSVKKKMVALSSDLNGVKRSIDVSQDPEEYRTKKMRAIEENGDKTAEPIAIDKPTSSFNAKLSPMFEALRTNDFSKMTRQGLEELIRHCFNDYLVNRSELGGMRQSLKELMEDRDRINKQCNLLKKQVSDAKHIIKRLIEEKEAAKGSDTFVAPVKVTRSVGLQVCTAGSFYVRPRSEFKSKAVEGEKENKAGGGGAEVGGGVATPTQPSHQQSPSLTSPTVQQSPLIRINTNTQKAVGNSGNGGKVQHFLIAKPVVPSAGAVRPSLQPAPTLNGRTSLTVTTTNLNKSSGNMEVIDLTDKEDKPDKVSSTQLVPIQPKLPPISPKVSHQSQISPGDIVELPDGTKPGQTICALAVNHHQVSTKSKGDKVDVSLIKSFVKLPPLPPAPKYGAHPVPPRPYLRIGKSNAGILLSWNFGSLKVPTKVALFQLYAYQESGESGQVASGVNKLWNKVGEVNALPLPMACTLTQFMEGHKYHFAVRAIDIHDRVGEFSAPGSIMLTSSNPDHQASLPVVPAAALSS